ncbi:MAG TPA: HEAT repeat domain-containing protein, partial [Oculatellaceae cyanobacterium]
IVRVLGRSEEPVLKEKAAQILIDFLNSKHPAATATPVKQALAEAWGQLREDGAIDALIGLLADSQESVRLHAIASLRNFPTARQQLEQLATLENLTPELKQGVVSALAEW